MKKALIIATLSAAMMSSCVTLGKYEALEATNNQIKKEHNITKQELIEMREENSELLRQNQSLTSRVKDLSETTDQQIGELQKLRAEMGEMRMSYDTLIENYKQRINGQSRDLNKANGQLAARDKELNDREVAFAAKEQAFLTQQRQLEAKQSQLEKEKAEMKTKQEALEKEEKATKAALAAKEKELDQVRKAVTDALVGFKNKGLDVETKNGKVYVSMESKLMFASGSWTVSKEGIQAIKELAKVLEENPDLNIMVEGHTDNVAFKSSSSVKDNWDLSVMRATSIVKLLLQYGPQINPARIEASGHSEYAPKVPNTSAENKAINRRTEIILTPNINDILKLVN